MVKVIYNDQLVYKVVMWVLIAQGYKVKSQE